MKHEYTTEEQIDFMCRVKEDSDEETIPLVKAVIQTLENNQDWILCNKEVPKISNSYLVTKIYENDDNLIYETSLEVFWTNDNKWDCERNENCKWKVIAWQNKPKPCQLKI